MVQHWYFTQSLLFLMQSQWYGYYHTVDSETCVAYMYYVYTIKSTGVSRKPGY